LSANPNQRLYNDDYVVTETDDKDNKAAATSIQVADQ